MAAWTAGILLALGLAWFVGAVVVPALKVRSVLIEQERELLGDDEVILRLGGKARAAKMIVFYYRLPYAPEPNEPKLHFLLSHTLPEGTEGIAKGLTTGSAAVRRCMAEALIGCASGSSGPTKGWQPVTNLTYYRPRLP